MGSIRAPLNPNQKRRTEAAKFTKRKNGLLDPARVLASPLFGFNILLKFRKRTNILLAERQEHIGQQQSQ